MKAASVRAILQALSERKVRYLIAGGLAVNAYGFLCYTKDADIVIELVPGNIETAFAALSDLGYQPAVPINAQQFADPENRETWIRDKDMKVLQFWSDQHRQTPIGVFLQVPFEFDAEYAAAPIKQLREIGPIPIVTLHTLLQMKKSADRTQDRIDLENLALLYPNETLPNA